MRRSFPAVLALMFATLAAYPAGAQITLVPGPPHLVSFAPKFIAAADFNKDGIRDAVVTNSTSRKVSVLFGGTNGSFASIVDIPVGRVLRGIAAGDLNGDNNPDIAVLDFLDGRVFRITGNGAEGTFNAPEPYPIGLRPLDITIGEFDGQNGKDLASANPPTNRATVLLNRGGNRGFVPLGTFDLGKTPKRLESGDLNGDGFDDIVAVNTGTRAADDVSILLNTGNGSFQPPTNFVVGAGAKDLAITDINGDGALDILVLNGAAVSALNTFSASVLLNKPEGVRCEDVAQPASGHRVGTGIFCIEPPVTVRCPASISGILIDCIPNFLASGDFDGDGFADFAVSFFTRNQAGGGTAPPGLVEAFAGHGDGTFDFAQTVSLIGGFDPQGIVAADFTGDTIADIAVAQLGSNSVRILSSLAPPKRSPGDSCLTDRQCGSGACVDGVCCGSPSCPSGQFCNIPGRKGTCSLPASDGTRCDSGAQCDSTFCVDGFCCGTRSCPASQFCNTGTCMIPTDNGTQCNNGQQCTSGFCVDNVCCATEECPVDQACNLPGLEGTCDSRHDNGVPCTDGGQCLTTFCLDGVCCQTSSCPAGQFCNLTGQEGVCNLRPTPSATPTLTPTPTRTPTPQPTGFTCDGGVACTTGFCVDGVCCGTAVCPVGMRCNVEGKKGQCVLPPPAANGQPCGADANCSSGHCVEIVGGTGVCCGSATCAVGQSCKVPGKEGNCSTFPTSTPSLTPTLTPTPTPKGPGASCSIRADCRSDLFCTNAVCCTSASCASGQRCDVEGSQGQCRTVPTPTPTLKPPGAPCNPSGPNQCDFDLVCNSDGVCCEQDSCPVGQRCDITDLEGVCSDPKGPNEDCTKNADCAEGLQCVFNEGLGGLVCTAPPTPLPTVIFEPSPTPIPPDVTISRGGGCSIGRSGTDRSSAWLLAAFPVAVWLRRRGWVQARIHRARRKQ